ncbi:hypothetical protein QOZ80_2BG0205010 [Eleusine coracana subsp. coracana]|nr:hypothetical protein QOZ80_2BG0205010 [Eleusine coracana subsp. coracana]
MEFMALGEGRKKRIVAADHKCRTILCDIDMAYHAVSTLPALHAPKISPVSIPVGDSLYVLKTNPVPGEEHCFEALIHGRGPESRCRPDWYWHSLPPPPYVQAPCYEVDEESFEDIYGHALVGGVHIWVSTGHAATYSFSTVANKWSKVGNWDLPFGGRAEYIPELNVSLGFSLQDNLLCASDLAGASVPKLLGKWEDVVQPQESIPLTSNLVPLGSGKLFIAKFFQIRRRRYIQGDYINDSGECFAVFTGVQLEYSGGQLSMRKHKSMRYTPFCDLQHWVI